MTSFLRNIAFIFIMFSSISNAQVFERLPVKFVTEANYYPFEFFSKSKKIEGFDIDIAKAICDQVNLQCSFEHHRFDGLLQTLQFGRYDAAIAALDITKERLKVVDFSDSYYKTAPVFISKEGLQGEFSLAGKFIGVQSNSSNQNYLSLSSKGKSYIVPYFSSQAALEDLKQHKIDAVFADFAVVNNFLSKQSPDTKLVITHTEAVFVTEFSKGYGIAVKKGNNNLRERLNIGLKLIIENGTYKNIYQQYFPSYE
ncbi:transporter substrate-binding domain-containing protein [Psychromonas sp. RZ22]|uniref:transporter substrate-binding domain-containing protein n=1 Tax=Psychromonas algarum TaxID=2555643 RepID=UPI001068676C|nr:transporter substrate-binding domain-containing protein [Psychromonas sp. RZ22]TEW56752.1 transporter substrate-binding domain-containing protein [Psychromonas sp. RZ22]